MTGFMDDGSVYVKIRGVRRGKIAARRYKKTSRDGDMVVQLFKLRTQTVPFFYAANLNIHVTIFPRCFFPSQILEIHRRHSIWLLGK